MSNRYPLAFFVLCASSGLFGCTTSGDPSGELEPGPRMQLRQGCLRNSCSARLSAESRACIDCTSACFGAGYDCNPSDACDWSCAPSTPCSEAERAECVEEGFEVVLPNNPSRAVSGACQRFVAEAAACGLSSLLDDVDCEHYATVERPAVAAHYDCVAAAPCGDWANEGIAHCLPPASTLGDTMCATVSATCGSPCPEDVRTWLNQRGAWWREDVIAVGIACMEQDSCEDLVDCFDVWAAAAGGA